MQVCSSSQSQASGLNESSKTHCQRIGWPCPTLQQEENRATVSWGTPRSKSISNRDYCSSHDIKGKKQTCSHGKLFFREQLNWDLQIPASTSPGVFCWMLVSLCVDDDRPRKLTPLGETLILCCFATCRFSFSATCYLSIHICLP